MDCEICGTSPFTLVLLQLKQPDGRLNTFACLKCARASSAYCKKHRAPHELGFDDGTTACTRCIEAMVRVNQHRASSLLAHLKEILPPEELAELKEAAEPASLLMRCDEKTAILRFLATKATRLNSPLEQIVDLVATTRSADHLLV